MIWNKIWKLPHKFKVFDKLSDSRVLNSRTYFQKKVASFVEKRLVKHFTVIQYLQCDFAVLHL